MMGSAVIQAQDYLDVPTWDGEEGTTLDKVIWGDTLADGSRASANRVYRLERGGFYIIAGNPPISYSFAMIAGDDTNTGDGSGRLPVVARGKYSTGVNVQNLLVFNRSNNHYYFENIIFTAVDLDGAYETQWTAGLQFHGNNIRVEIKGCVFNAWQAGAVTLDGEGSTLYMSDNVFRNGVATYHPFVGQQGNFSAHAMDSLVITNNLYVNNQATWVRQGGQGLADYVVFEHNTIVTSLVPTLELREMTNALIRSNIFYGEGAYGDNEFSKKEHWYTDDESGMATLYYRPVQGTQLSDAGLTEADRIIEATNNAYFTPKAIKDYHNAHDKVTGNTFINTGTQTTMFDDKTAYPKLKAENNVEKDPKFGGNTAALTHIVDGVALQCEELYSSKAAGKGWGANSSRRNIDEDLGESDIMLFDWPLVEGTFPVTESSLLTAGHDGLPVGYLGWDSASRDQYEYPQGVGGFQGLSMFGGSLANNDYDFTSQGYELSSYPNPVNSIATISFKLPKAANVTISVYSIMGQKISTITSSSFAKGTHTVQWDASNVASGLYIYKLDTDEVSQAHQMIITK